MEQCFNIPGDVVVGADGNTSDIDVDGMRGGLMRPGLDDVLHIPYWGNFTFSLNSMIAFVET